MNFTIWKRNIYTINTSIYKLLRVFMKQTRVFKKIKTINMLSISIYYNTRKKDNFTFELVINLAQPL